MKEGNRKQEDDWAIRQRTVKKEREVTDERGKQKAGRRLGYKAKNSEEERRRNGWKRETVKRKRTGLSSLSSILFFCNDCLEVRKSDHYLRLQVFERTSQKFCHIVGESRTPAPLFSLSDAVVIIVTISN